MNGIRLGKLSYGLNPVEQVRVVGFCASDLHVFHPIPPLALGNVFSDDIGWLIIIDFLSLDCTYTIADEAYS
jgi:hypothetical protein